MSQTETMMVFVLGVATTLLIVLLFGRGLWSMMGRWSGWQQTRMVPFAIRELQAERDGLKAEKAMISRKLESSVADMKMRLAEQMAEVSRNRNRLLDATAQLKTSHGQNEGLRQSLHKTQQEAEALKAQVDENVKAINGAWAKMAERDGEVGRLQQVNDSSQQAIFSRDERINNLESETKALRDIVAMVAPTPNDSATGDSVFEERLAEMKAKASNGRASHVAANSFEARFNAVASGNPLTASDTLPVVQINSTQAALSAQSNVVTPVMTETTQDNVNQSVSNVLSLAQRVRGLHRELKK